MHISKLTAPALFIAALLLAAPAVAGTLVVSFVPSSPDEATIELRHLNRLADYGEPPAIIRRSKLDTPLTVELPEGHWALDVSSPALWHETQTVSVFSAPVAIEAALLQAADITGHVRTTEKSELPREVKLAFAGSREGVVPCPVVDGMFRCRIPAGISDLRLRASGFVTRFFWQQNASHTTPLDLGNVTLVRGATLVGRVDVESGLKIDAGSIHVRAKGANESIDAVVGPRGLFHIDGIAPGAYDVAAASGARVKSQIVHIEVKPFTTAEMQDVLRLQRPKTLRVLVLPAFDPEGKPWRLQLARYAGRELQPVTGSAASILGEWSADRLSAGKYELSVLAADGSKWYRETVELASGDSTLNVTVPARVLHGTITRAGKPVSAGIELSDAHSSISFESDDTGRFGGAIPLTSGEWTVTVKSDTPPVRCNLEHVRPTKREDSSDVDLAIALPNTAITGTVTDESGAAVAAMVNISGLTGTQQVRANDDGSFFVAGLPPGNYSLEASAFLKQSPPTNVTLTEDAAEPVKLVVEDVEKIHGRVISDFGPIAGAIVVITPTNVPSRLVPVNWTDEAGEFSTFAPHGTLEVNILVIAAGYPLKFFHSPMHRGLLTIPVPQTGGSMRVRKGNGDVAPHLLHNGALQSVDAMAWTSAVVDAGDELIVPSIEPGPYLLCMLSNEEAAAVRGSLSVPAGRCHSGFLPPFGALTFTP